ncbi:MAG TPA: hypothetical protein VGC13_08780 [Longimicrobium sp.]|uniref:hypothetical protein n=1 Tax=Longimicrobium sp. TaxID=2029185 RepID=UPI002ED835D3
MTGRPTLSESSDWPSRHTWECVGAQPPAQEAALERYAWDELDALVPVPAAAHA